MTPEENMKLMNDIVKQSLIHHREEKEKEEAKKKEENERIKNEKR
jgi:hypothetical protein